MFSATMCYREGAFPDAKEGDSLTMDFDTILAYNNFAYEKLEISTSTSQKAEFQITSFSNGDFVTTTQNGLTMEIKYYNDTEIT